MFCAWVRLHGLVKPPRVLPVSLGHTLNAEVERCTRLIPRLLGSTGIWVCLRRHYNGNPNEHFIDLSILFLRDAPRS